MLVFLVLFFKQKTAYEMRISDWSSDVCSSDLGAGYVKYQVDGNEALAPLPNLKGELHRPADREAIGPRRTRIADELAWHREDGATVIFVGRIHNEGAYPEVADPGGRAQVEQAIARLDRERRGRAIDRIAFAWLEEEFAEQGVVGAQLERIVAAKG